MDEPPSDASAPDQRQLKALWEALQRASKRDKPPSQLLSEFAGGIADVVSTDDDGSINKYDLLCPRKECGSVILKKGVAMLAERPSVQLEPTDAERHELLPALPEAPEGMEWWLISPSPMAFENIGFSRPVSSPSSQGTHLKLLACAECDLGPLGWSVEGGREFWLASTRVGYQLT
ncbi:hypothetical protein APHAL10511_000220 [Amanita phalloides]|nr:hypothetical protein APHAL10511_000220 [Amanita phalloides]